MPIYDYECRLCGHVVEVIHGVNDSGPNACDRCGGPVRKLLTQPAIVFRGSGWAKKDRNTKPDTKKTETDTKAAEPADKAEPAAATAKPDSTSSQTASD